MQAAAGNLKKVSLELGGKSPNVVFGDVDIDAAIAGCVERDLLQSRTVLLRWLSAVHREPIFDKVVEGVSDRADKIRVGPGMEPSTEMGPLVSEEQLNRVCGYLESGFSDGAKAVTGGQRQGDKGYFVETHRARKHQ